MENVKKILEDHREYIASRGERGKIANFENASLRHCDFSGDNLDKVIFRGADCTGATFDRASLKFADFSDAVCNDASFDETCLVNAELLRTDFSESACYKTDFEGSNLRGAMFMRSGISAVSFEDCSLSGAVFAKAYLRHCNFKYAEGREVSFKGTDLTSSDFSYASFIGSDFTGSKISEVNLNCTNLSGCKGLNTEMPLEKCEEGWIGYKVYGDTTWPSPSGWVFEEGSILEEVVNPDLTSHCACGINIGSKEWVTEDPDKLGYVGDIWKVLIRWEWAHTIVVPYNSVGKIRCSKCELVKKVGHVGPFHKVTMEE